jgi:hypothetical protein
MKDTGMDQTMLQHALFHKFEAVAAHPSQGLTVNGMLRNAFAMTVLAVPLLIMEADAGVRHQRSHDIYGYASWQDPQGEAARRPAAQGPDFAPGAAITRADVAEEDDWWTRLRARFGRPAARQPEAPQMAPPPMMSPMEMATWKPSIVRVA